MAEESDHRDRDPFVYKGVDFLDTALSLFSGELLVFVLCVIAFLGAGAVAAGLMVEFAIGLVVLLVGWAAVRTLSDWT